VLCCVLIDSDQSLRDYLLDHHTGGKPGQWDDGPAPSIKRQASATIDVYNKTIQEKVMKIKNNDLTHYFIRDHGSLPPAYLASCRKFFQELSNKHQAPSNKLRQNVARQSVRFKSPGIRVKNRFQRKV